jgi:hypothetical protein
MQTPVAIAPELLRSLTHQARVDRRTLVRHLSDPPVHSHPAGQRIRDALKAQGLDHLVRAAGEQR